MGLFFKKHSMNATPPASSKQKSLKEFLDPAVPARFQDPISNAEAAITELSQLLEANSTPPIISPISPVYSRHRISSPTTPPPSPTVSLPPPPPLTRQKAYVEPDLSDIQAQLNHIQSLLEKVVSTSYANNHALRDLHCSYTPHRRRNRRQERHVRFYKNKRD